MFQEVDDFEREFGTVNMPSGGLSSGECPMCSVRCLVSSVEWRVSNVARLCLPGALYFDLLWFELTSS